MKTITLDGVEYELTPVANKKQELSEKYWLDDFVGFSTMSFEVTWKACENITEHLFYGIAFTENGKKEFIDGLEWCREYLHDYRNGKLSESQKEEAPQRHEEFIFVLETMEEKGLI